MIFSASVCFLISFDICLSADLKGLSIYSDENYNFINLDFSEGTTEGGDVGSDSDLNVFVQLQDIIEYREKEQDIPKKGRVVSIGSLANDEVIQVNDGTWLARSKHFIRRIEISRSDGGAPFTNPNPSWRSLQKVFVIPAHEDVDVDSDEEDDCDDRHSVTTVESLFGQADEPSPAETSLEDDTGGDVSVRMTSCGSTRITRETERKQIKREEEFLDKRRPTEKYLRWANPTEYKSAKDTVNRYYLECLQFGIVDDFNRIKLFDAPTKEEYDKREKMLYNKINYRNNKNFVKLQITAPITFMDNVQFGKRIAAKETHRQRRTLEELLKFEHRMRTLILRTCSICRENKLEFSDNNEVLRNGSSVLDETQPLQNPQSESYRCSKCTKNKLKAEEDYYLTSNLHPVWYERCQDGTLKIGNDGKPIARYDIPFELKCLTMAEKLLIRRCSPLIPSHHIKNGVYGIQGHCVCFPQDIEQMCSDLPQQQSNMVIFVRHLNNRISGDNHSTHFKVNKEKVIRALKWLKVHHRGYHNITITESNLDWIEGDSVYDSANKYEFKTKYQKRDAVYDTNEVVSSNQCKDNDGDDDNGMTLETVHPNYKQNVPNPAQSEIIRSFMKRAKTTNDAHKVLDFPPVDQNDPMK